MIIKLDATLNKATTTIDGGWRITFDLGEWVGPEVARLAEMRERNLALIISDEVIKIEDDTKNN